jgi:hypothetical protein
MVQAIGPNPLYPDEQPLPDVPLVCQQLVGMYTAVAVITPPAGARVIWVSSLAAVATRFPYASDCMTLTYRVALGVASFTGLGLRPVPNPATTVNLLAAPAIVVSVCDRVKTLVALALLVVGADTVALNAATVAAVVSTANDAPYSPLVLFVTPLAELEPANVPEYAVVVELQEV